MQSKTEAVIFDLDGTVINSYPGILSAFNAAYKKLYGIDNHTCLTPFIGPPVQQILTSVNGETDIEKIALFVSYFKERYDTMDFKLSQLYEGLEELLYRLFEKGVQLFIATNKREKPTKLIIDHLKLNNYFSGLYCSDLTGKNYVSKVEMIADLLSCESLHKQNTFLVGDTTQDEMAAAQNNVPFIYAGYGFGELEGIEKTILKPLDTLKFINI